jgi:hypothetical protein
MAITFKQIAAELIPAAHELLQDNMKKYQDDNLYNWHQSVFDVQATSDWENELVSMTSTRLWPEYDEQLPIPQTVWDATDKTILELTEFVDSFKVTRRYLKYGDAATAVQSVFPRLRQFVPDFLRRGLLRHSQLAGLVLLDVFAGNIYTGLDGQPMASIHHANPVPGGADLRNVISNNLDLLGLQAAWDLFPTWLDAEEVPLGARPDTLVVGPNNVINAFNLISNSVLPGATNAQRNPWIGIINKVVECPWFNDSIVAGSGQWWGLGDSRRQTLTGYVGEMPHLLDDPKITPMEMHVIGITSGVYGWHDWRGWVWSRATAT